MTILANPQPVLNVVLHRTTIVYTADVAFDILHGALRSRYLWSLKHGYYLMRIILIKPSSVVLHSEVSRENHRCRDLFRFFLMLDFKKLS